MYLVYALFVVETLMILEIVHLENQLVGRNLLGFLREQLCMLTKMDPTYFGYQKKCYTNVWCRFASKENQANQDGSWIVVAQGT